MRKTAITLGLSAGFLFVSSAFFVGFRHPQTLEDDVEELRMIVFQLNSEVRSLHKKYSELSKSMLYRRRK